MLLLHKCTTYADRELEAFMMQIWGPTQWHKKDACTQLGVHGPSLFINH